MKNLPKSWCVRNDGSNTFKATVIKYMNEHYNSSFNGRGTNLFYGVNQDGFATYYDNDSYFGKTLSLSEFIELSKEEWVPKRGEVVEVRDAGTLWVKRIFLATIHGGHSPYIVVCGTLTDENAFRNGETFSYYSYTRIRKFEQPQTLEIKSSEAFDIIAKAKGVDKSLIKIVE